MPTVHLTNAEMRLLQSLPSHRTLREIADQTGVSINTVKTQVRSVYRKLGACSRSEAVESAQRLGLLAPGLYVAPPGGHAPTAPPGP